MRSFSCAQDLPRLWYRPRLAAALYPLLPLSWLFAALAALRRALYAVHALRSLALPVPVVVVGNLTVGGSGKTPLVLWLVAALRAAGWRPGIVSRGYAAPGAPGGAQAVAPDSDPRASGDEALLLARRSGVPVFVGVKRVDAAAALLAAHPECNVIVSDDGLQHYRLRRCVEVAVFDERAAGNGHLLPAGPLREPLRRLRAATALVWNGKAVAPVAAELARIAPALPQFTMRLHGQRFFALDDERRSCLADDLRGKPLHAIAGIGDPARFFRQLKSLGLVFEAHAFADHHDYAARDLAFASDAVVLMTEKDAVKCRALYEACGAREAWVLPVEAQVESALDGASLLDLILEKINGHPPA